MEHSFLHFIASTTDFLWGKILVVFLLVMGLLFTFSSRFVQLRYFTSMFSIFKNAMKKTGGVSSFQALILSISGRVGAGNIAGVSVAIALGGPGAVFWMWCTAVLGMATSFFECTLAQVYKRRDVVEGGEIFRGGPFNYIKDGTKFKWLAYVYAIALFLTFGLALTPIQSFTIAQSVQHSFHVPLYITGFVLALLLALIVLGGVRRIIGAAEILVPFMAVLYLIFTVIFFLMNIKSTPHVFSEIFAYAFGIKAMSGGGLGTVIMMGVRRGLYSNEAGLGSAPNVAAVAKVKHPAEQGVVQALSVFIDSIIICTCTAFLILFSGVYHVGQGVENAAVLTQQAVQVQVGPIGAWVVTIALILFSFTTIMYNYYLGECALVALSIRGKLSINIYRLVVVGLAFVGCVESLSTVFSFGDLSMGILAVVNLVALAILIKPALKVMRDYDSQLKSGIKEPIFHASKFPELHLEQYGVWGREGFEKSE